MVCCKILSYSICFKAECKTLYCDHLGYNVDRGIILICPHHSSPSPYVSRTGLDPTNHLWVILTSATPGCRHCTDRLRNGWTLISLDDGTVWRGQTALLHSTSLWLVLLYLTILTRRNVLHTNCWCAWTSVGGQVDYVAVQAAMN